MRISCRQFTYFTRICILCLALKTGLYGADLLNQSINSGGGWVTGSENSSFSVFGELYQSNNIPSKTHTADLNSTVALDMIWVEPGTFTMGSPTTEAGRSTNETEHNVTLTEGFYLGKYEVTQAQYEAVMTGNTDGLSATPSNFSGYPNRPVEQVSWDDIQIFLERLNEQETDNLPAGWAYVLPTEAEWEYACRAGTNTVYSWGDDINSSRANYNQGFGQTSDVGHYAANPWGFFDMHGNVHEWTNDWYQAAYPSDNPLVDPTGPESGSFRILRGGPWSITGLHLRSAYRSSYNPGDRDSDIGFRVSFKNINDAPIDLNSTEQLAIAENQPVGTVVGEFNSTDAEDGVITYHFVAGENNNSLFTLDQNGTLKTATTFDYESNASTYSIRVEAKDEYNATVEENFTVTLTNLNEAVTGLVTLIGTPIVGQTLTASNTLTDQDGMGTVSYNWYRDGNPINYGGDLKSGENGVSGMVGSRNSAVSPDGYHVYVGGYSDGTISWFKRDPHSGNLQFVGKLTQGVNGVDGLTSVAGIGFSPSGEHVYISSGWGGNAISWYDRNASSGALTWQGVIKDDQGGVDGLYSAGKLVVSPKGTHVYVTAYDDDAVSWYQRNPVSGALTWLGVAKDGVDGVDGLDGARDLLLSKDGKFLYISGAVDSAIAWFDRNDSTGALAYLGLVRDGANGVDGLGAVTSIASNPSGSTLYASSQHDHSVAWFDRNASDGSLIYVNIIKNGDPGINSLNITSSLETSPDGKHLYCTGGRTDGNSSVNLFDINSSTGGLVHRDSYVALKDGDNLLNGIWSFSLSPDGRNLYASSSQYSSVAWFVRDGMLGELFRGTTGGASHLLSTTDQGAAISLQVSYTDGGGYSESLSSSPTANVNAMHQPSRPTHFASSAANLEMIWVEPGTFTMGSPITEVGRGTDETEHNVTLTEGFYLGKYEVTQAQYEAVMTGNTDGLSATPSYFSGYPNRPVEQVSWHDTQVFLDRLNEQAAESIPAGWAYVLPTEAQWEYACRAGTTTTYSWGNDINSSFANYNQNIDETTDVGQYGANPWGFRDMHGNVWEWVIDWWEPNNSSPVIDPLGPASGFYRGVRGGSWINLQGGYSQRSASRGDGASPSHRTTSRGFRLGFRQITEPPVNLGSVAELTVSENQPIGTIVGEFNATDPEGGQLTYQFVSGTSDNDLFTLESNGTLRTATVFDFESNASVYTVRIKAMNEFNATVEKQFPVTLLDLDDEKPVIVLNGDGNVTHEVGSLYQDVDARWSDNVDGEGTVVGIGEVNASAPGINTIVFDFTDQAGNQATTVTRTVTVVDTTGPVITLIGDANLTHEAGSEYVDAGAVWSDLVDGNGTADANGTVNVNVPGTYEITYSFIDSNGNSAQPMVRTVQVIDTTGPVITLIGDKNVTHLAGLEYIDQGAVWSDLVDGTGTADATGTVVVNVPGTYEITYSAMDDAGNFAVPVVRQVNVIDSESPVITLNGFANLTHEAGSEYVDAGAVWNDLVDGNGTADANGTVNINVPGTYEITYSFTDLSGNQASPVVRMISVVDTTQPVITLNGDANLTHDLGFDYIDEGAVWNDLVDGNGKADANGTVDIDVPDTYTISYNFTDSSGNQATPVVRTIEVINKSPSDLNSTQVLSVLENQPIGTIVGDFNATDPDGEEFAFSLVNGVGEHDNSLFKLEQNGTLATAEILDFEESSTRSIQVQVHDLHGAFISEVFTVSIIDQDEDLGENPPINLRSVAPLSVMENRQAGFSVGRFIASDLDGDELVFSLVEGEGDIDNKKFELSRAGLLTTFDSFNFEDLEIQNIRVAVSDQRGGEISKSFEVMVIDQNDFPEGLGTIEDLKVQENQPVGTAVGQLSAMDEDGDTLAFSFVRGPGDDGNEKFTLSEDGVLVTAKEFDFEEEEAQSIRVSADDGKGGAVSASFKVIILDQFENDPPTDLNTTGVPSVAENREIGTVVTQFKAIDRDEDELIFSLVRGEGDRDNSLFVLDENGTLTTAAILDFEEAETRSVRVQVMDTHGESTSEQFTIQIIDHENEEIILEVKEFRSDGRAGEIGKLKVLGRSDVTFGLGQDERGAMHMFLIEDDGTLMLAENARENGTFNLTVLISKDEELLDKQPVTVQLKIDEPENFMEADTSDSTYHETALMIRDLAVVQDDWRNGHNPITAIENKVDGLFVKTAQPHGRKEKDSVVLSGIKGILVDGIENWNFMIDKVGTTSFRLRRFGKDEDGLYDGSLGDVVQAVDETAYQSSPSDFLLGPWTFGHLLGNMVSEENDPLSFYKHFASQWNHVQTVNGWDSDRRQSTHSKLVPDVELTLANIPFRLLAIGNRIDLFHAKSMRKVQDAGEGRFVFTMTQAFELPVNDETIWGVHEKTNDIRPSSHKDFTLIFEYGQPASDFATLAKWAMDWHGLQREKAGSSFDFDDQYFQQLNELTDRFSKRGSHPTKHNGNPINQVRTNDFIHNPWQMREFNLVSKVRAHGVKAHPSRDTTLVADGEIDIGLWTTTTKNNPMVGSNKVEESIEKPLARWINQRENHILSADVGPRAPEWMEGPVANEPVQFTYKLPGVRTNFARYKYSLSTCSGCHTGDTGKSFQFQMVRSEGISQKAHFVPFMVGNSHGGMHEVEDRENIKERHEFFDLKAREEIARDILSVAQQIDAARLRLTRTEIERSGLGAPAHAFVRGGIIGDWQYDLPGGREDNDFYTLNSSTGELSIRGNGQIPPLGKGRISIRARATNGTGVVIERPYSLWVLSPDDPRLMEDLDASIQPSDLPPLATPRPNRTH